jgi:hypothetical protein
MTTPAKLPAPEKPELLSDFSQFRYLAYPHSNGFADGGKSLIIGQIQDPTVSLWKYDLASGKEAQLCSFDRETETEKILWFDVAEKTNRLGFVAENSFWIMEIARPDSLRRFYQAPAGHHLAQLPSINADGTFMVASLKRPDGTYEAIRVSTETGRVEVLFKKSWWVNHLHFCPHDESWIGFCHEGPTLEIPRRVWGWHATKAPEGDCLFDHGPLGLALGHERWCFHATSNLCVAYGVSPEKPRGIYEIFPDGREPRLVSEGDRDFHVGVTRDGRWAVVDTTGPWDRPGSGWENAEDKSDIVLIDMKTGERHFVAHSRQYMRHPRHPHPTFSPDGSTIFFNESSPDTTSNRILRVANPGWNL